MIAALLALLPVTVTLLMVLVAALPWGGPPWSETALALLPAASIYFWSLRRPHLMPALLVFSTGLVLDVLTHSPLGVWACTVLVVGLAGRVTRRVRPPLGWLGSAAALVATFAIATAIVGTLDAAIAWRPLAFAQHVQALAAICLAYPILAVLYALLERLWPVADGRSLFARGD
jgi:rod shape-determining protein MreD